MKVTRLGFLAILCLSSFSNAMSLQEAIKLSLANNPKMVANELRVKAMQDRTKAQWADLLPSLNIGTSMDFSNDGVATATSRGTRLSTNLNVYHGGADVYAQKSLQASLKAADARYASSNAMIPNTKGSIARNVKNAYVDLVDAVEQQKYIESVTKTLQIFVASNPTDDERLLIQQRENNLKTSILRSQASLEAAKRDFLYFATVPAPDLNRLDSFDQVTDSLIIPQSSNEAFQLALQKSPDLKVAEYELEASKYEYKAQKARLYAPRVDVNASVGRSNFNYLGTSSGAANKSLGISLSYQLSASSHLRDSAAAKSVQASTRDHDGAIDELKYDIDSIYPSLESQQQIFEAQLQNLKSAQDSLDQIIQKIQAGQKVDLKTALSVLDSQSQYWSSCLIQKRSIIDTRFNIQRTVGTLFDGLGLPPSAMSAIQ